MFPVIQPELSTMKKKPQANSFFSELENWFTPHLTQLCCHDIDFLLLRY